MKQTLSNRLNSLRLLVGRFAFVALVLASFGVMLLGKADTMMAERLRVTVADALAPMMEILSEPAATVSGVTENMRELASIREENTRLRVENQRLMRWRTAARMLEVENASLKDLLNFAPDPRASFVSGRVVADTGGVFARSVIVLAGARERVSKGDAALSGEGLVGRVSEAGRRAARVILLTDINSRIPVAVGGSRQRAILAGDNTDRPKLIFLRSAASVSPGDRIVTSGAAGAFPPGLPVGVVASMTEHETRIEPYFRRDQLEHVRLVDYGLPGVLGDLTPGKADGAASVHGAR